MQSYIQTQTSLTPYTYCFVRTDIPVANQIVQASHACLERGLSLSSESIPKITSFLVLLKVENEDKLMRIAYDLQKARIKTTIFFEPDIFNGEQMGNTAICTEPVYGDRRNIFNKYELWDIAIDGEVEG